MRSHFRKEIITELEHNRMKPSESVVDYQGLISKFHVFRGMSTMYERAQNEKQDVLL
jgi:hypothetical protein